jgi:ankyrin repeat protein
VIAYHAGKKTIHRLIDAGPEDDFFEAPYAQVRKQLFEDEGYDAIFNTHPAYSRISHLIVPLFEAAYKLDTDAIFFLSRRGARISDVVSRLQNVNFPVRLLRNPFISASEHGRLEVIDQLLALESFEHPWTQRWLGEALSTALKHPRKFEIAEKLLWHGANLTWTKLPSELTRDIDLMYGYPKLSAALRDQASDLTTAPFRDNRDEPGIQARGFQGVTKLIVSVSSASPAMCQALLNSGADPNAYDSFGMTALMEAIYYGNKEAALLLLSNGADPNHFASGSLHMAGEWTKRNQIAATYQEKKWSATHLAAHRGLTSIITALLEAGAQLDVVDHDGHTPLDLAMQASHHATAFFLLSLDCPFDKNSPDASRLLARAIEECKYHAAEKLIKAGAALPTETWDGDLQTDFGLIQQFYRSSGDRLSLTVL